MIKDGTSFLSLVDREKNSFIANNGLEPRNLVLSSHFLDDVLVLCNIHPYSNDDEQRKEARELVKNDPYGFCCKSQILGMRVTILRFCKDKILLVG